MHPILLSDRISIQFLQKHYPDLHSALVDRGFAQGEDGYENGLVKFCGMVALANGTLAVFLPRSCQRDKEFAKMTMQSLARYGADSKNRIFENDDGWGNCGLLSVILRLTEDFVRSGLYSERERIFSRNVGKPDWAKTIKSITPVEIRFGEPGIYPDLITTKIRDSNAVLIAKIQACVMAEILDSHGWWIAGLTARRSLLRGMSRPEVRRSLWPALLRRAQSDLYSTRSLNLVRDLIFYLEQCRDRSEGAMIFGMTDFHNAWEAMLRCTLKGVSLGWNARLPKPVYYVNEKLNAEAPQRGMQTDIIVEDSFGLHIIDAKYYAAATAQTVPGWPDIAKQMFYELALRSVVGPRQSIRNSFIFPGSVTAGRKSFHHVRMQSQNGQEATQFPRVECHYLAPERVMQSYLSYKQDIEILEPVYPT